MSDLDAVARLSERQRVITIQRNEALTAARAAGASWRELARASGLSVEGVRQIVRRQATS